MKNKLINLNFSNAERFIQVIYCIKLLLVLIIYSASLNAQTIVGRVIDLQTKEPVPFVNVFISNTTKGTQTDEKGEFKLNALSSGYLKIIASMLGYKPFEKEYIIRPNETIQLTISLEMDARLLNEVKVTGNKDKEWKRFYSDFEAVFIGKTSNAKNCKIQNPYDIDVVKVNQSLTAKANKTIEIENKSLGYTISYQLIRFQSTKSEYNFSGQTLFKTLLPANDTETQLWNKNRQKAYQGSLRHFLIAVVNKTSAKVGFKVYIDTDSSGKINRDRYFRNNTLREISLDTLAKFDANLQRVTIPARRYEIHYLNRTDPQNWYFDLHHEVSWLEIKGSVFAFSYNGVPENPNQTEIVGSMGKRRVADLLPDDYQASLTQPPLAADDSAGFIPNYQKQEKLTITTDRNIYIKGETIRFQINVLEATTQEPLNKSFVYVTLRTPEQLIDHYKIWVEQGEYKGTWVVPDSLPSGIYQFIVHTNWGRNFDEHFWGRKNIHILSDKSKKTIINQNDSLHLSLLPESGNLLLNVNNRIGFSIFQQDGTPVMTNGWVLNQQNDTLASLKSNEEGYGSFYFLPSEKQPLKIALNNGKEYAVSLPAITKGFIMQVDALNDSSSIIVRIINNLSASEWKPLRLVAHLRGKIVFEAIVTPQRNLTTVRIARDELEEDGVMELILLDGLNTPIASRAFYQGYNSEIPLNSVLPYLSTELYAYNPVSTPALNNREALKCIDLMLICHKTRSYTLVKPSLFEQESGISIKGKVTQTNGKALSHLSIIGIVMADSSRVSFQAQTDESGHFKSSPLHFFGKAEVIIQPQMDKSKIAIISIDTVSLIPKWIWIPTPSIDKNQKDSLLQQITKREGVKTLQEVIVKNRKQPEQDSRRPYPFTDATIKIDDRKMAGLSFIDILRGKVGGVLVKDDGAYLIGVRDLSMNGYPLALFANGLPTTWETLKTLLWSDIEAIDLIKDPALSIGLGSTAKNGAINVLIKKTNSLLSNQNMRKFSVDGFRK